MSTVAFGSLIEDINRGIHISAKELQDLITEEKTDNQYLKLGNIDNGLLTGDLPYITEVEGKYTKYCLKNNTLVLSKIGFPTKIFVPQINEKLHILASGNFYLITLNLEKINPFYLAAFFNSDKGMMSLAKASNGQVIPTISLEKLKKIRIPMVSMEEQEKVGKEYQDTLKEIEALNAKLAKNVEKLSQLM